MAGKTEIRGKFFIQNKEVMVVSDFYTFDTTTIVYEVIRLIEGVPLFIEEHIDRLKSSCKEMHLDVDWNRFDFQEQLKFLAKQNNIENGNVMLHLIQGKNEIIERLYFIPHNYPSLAMYRNGVPVGLLNAERKHPNAKVVLQYLRERTNQYIKTNKLFEVLLVDKNEKITEASRANFFFVKDGKLITAPLDTVLKGITLLKVLQIAKEQKIKVEFKQVAVAELNQYDAAFLTGTSSKILPVNSIDNISFDVNNSTLLQLKTAYNKLIEVYIKNKIDQ